MLGIRADVSRVCPATLALFAGCLFDKNSDLCVFSLISVCRCLFACKLYTGNYKELSELLYSFKECDLFCGCKYGNVCFKRCAYLLFRSRKLKSLLNVISYSDYLIPLCGKFFGSNKSLRLREIVEEYARNLYAAFSDDGRRQGYRA